MNLVPAFLCATPLPFTTSLSNAAICASRPPRRYARVAPKMVTLDPASPSAAGGNSTKLADIGLIGLAVMGQNLALNIAESGFSIAVFNRSVSKTEDTVQRAQRENLAQNLVGYADVRDFVKSLSRPRKIIILVKAGRPVDATIDILRDLLEPGDLIIDGGNEYYAKTESRAAALDERGILYMGMGVSGGEEGARYGPSIMPGGPKAAWEMVKPIMEKVSAQVDDGCCVTYIGPGGSGNFVKMVHNGIEYGDMQLIGEAYDLLRNVAGLSVTEIADVFDEWNGAELQSFLIEITAQLLRQKDDVAGDGQYLVDRILDKTGSKGTGKWTIQEAAERGMPAPSIAASLDARYLSSMKEDRVRAASVLKGQPMNVIEDPKEKQRVIEDIRRALYASKICCYAQGMSVIRAAGAENDWGLDLGAIARIWKGGCIIRARFLDRIKGAYDRDAQLPSLLLDNEFAKEMSSLEDSWRRVAVLAIQSGIAIPSTSSSLAYYDTFRREVLVSAQLIQAQRDFFGSHTYQRLDREGVYHTRWSSDGVTEREDK